MESDKAGYQIKITQHKIGNPNWHLINNKDGQIAWVVYL